MQLSKYLHSCLLIEDGTTRILVDPGAFSFVDGKVRPEDFQSISAVLITHNHLDHADPAALKTILKNNPAAKVFGNADTKNLLALEGVEVNLFESGEQVWGNITVQAIPARHGTLVVPIPQNTAYVFNRAFLVTGDSQDEALHQFKNIKALALPMVAPWTKQVEIAAFAKALTPKVAIPVHDWLYKDTFRERMQGILVEYLAKSKTKLYPLELGETTEA